MKLVPTWAKFVMLPFGGLHVKRALQRGIALGLRKTLIELAGRRTFQMQTNY
jgi:hypothetical protein